MADYLNQINVLKKKASGKDVLIEFLDMVYTTDDKGNFNYKILMNVQESQGGNTDTTSFYWSMDELKQIAFEVKSGLMKGLKYPTSPANKDKLGMFEVIRGQKYGRQLKIGANENYVAVELNHYMTDASKSRNGEVHIVGDPTKSCKIVLTDYEARGFFGKVYDFIERIQLKEALQGTKNQELDKPSPRAEKQQEEPKMDAPPSSNTHTGDVPIVPGQGKFAGKPASEIPKSSHSWFIKTFKGKPQWEDVVKYLEGNS